MYANPLNILYYNLRDKHFVIRIIGTGSGKSEASVAREGDCVHFQVRLFALKLDSI